MKLHPLLPLLLILFFGALCIAPVYFAGKLSPYKHSVLTFLRISALILTMLFLLSPSFPVREADKQRSNLIFLLDGSESMKTCDVSGKSRYTAAADSLQKLLSYRYSDSGKYVYLFNHTAKSADDPEFRESFSPFGGTSLKNAFADAERDIGLSGAAAVVVLSDGIDNSGYAGAKSGVPVFAVKTGTSLNRVPDLSIGTIPPVPTLRPGEELELKIPVHSSGISGRQTLESTVNGKPDRRDEVIPIPGKTVFASRKFSFPEPGLYVIGLQLSGDPKEVSLLNNRRELVAEVIDDNLSAALYFPVLNNSFRPLARMFTAAGRKFTAVYKLRPDVCSVTGNNPDRVFDRGIPPAEKMKNIDIVVVSSFRDAFYSGRDLDNLEKYVRNGGILAILGGEDSFGPSADKRMNALSPLRASAFRFLPGDFRVSLPEDGNPMFSKIAGNAGTIQGLNLTDRLRDGAELLLQAENDKVKYPLLAAMRYGKGRVFAIASNSLQRWGAPADRKTNFRRFWEQLFIYAADGQNDRLGISVNTEYVQSGTPLNVTAYSSPGAKIEAEILSVAGTDPIRKRTLSENGLVYNGSFSDIPDGKWILKVTASDPENKWSRARFKMISVGSSIAENGELSVSDSNFLKFTVRDRVFLPGEESKLAAELNSLIARRFTGREKFPLSETPYTLAVLLLLLAAEWILRRRFNMF